MTNFSDAQLIFLISQPRAGSTLLQRILAGHPDVHTTAEPWLMLHPLYALRATGHRAEYDATLAYEALQDFCATLPDGRASYEQALRAMALQLYGEAGAGAGKPRFLDKTPRYYFIIPELARLFPAARFVILLRNPLAVLASILQTHVKGHWPLLSRYRHDLLTAPPRLVAGLDLLGERATRVHYEALVRDPEAETRALCAALALDFRPDMLTYGDTAVPSGRMGDTTGIEQHERPSADSLDRWQELARDAQTRHFLQQYLQALGPGLLAQMGYDAVQLAARLERAPYTPRALPVTWEALFAPEIQQREIYRELALLTYRRLVYRLREWRQRLRGGR